MNPVEKARKERGWSRREASTTLSLTYTDLSWAENGYFAALPKRIVVALDRVGFDGAAVQTEYQAWREARAKELLCGR